MVALPEDPFEQARSAIRSQGLKSKAANDHPLVGSCRRRTRRDCVAAWGRLRFQGRGQSSEDIMATHRFLKSKKDSVPERTVSEANMFLLTFQNFFVLFWKQNEGVEV